MKINNLLLLTIVILTIMNNAISLKTEKFHKNKLNSHISVREKSKTTSSKGLLFYIMYYIKKQKINQVAKPKNSGEKAGDFSTKLVKIMVSLMVLELLIGLR